jgi:hypothetical protein
MENLNNNIDSLNKNIKELNDISLFRTILQEPIEAFTKSATDYSKRLIEQTVHVGNSIKAFNESTKKYNKRMFLCTVALLIFTILLWKYAAYTFEYSKRQYNFMTQTEHQRRIGLLKSLLREYNFNMSIYKPIAEDKQYIEGKMGRQLQKFSDFIYLRCNAEGLIDNDKLYQELGQTYNLFAISNMLFDQIRATAADDVESQVRYYNKHKQNYDVSKQLFDETKKSLEDYIEKMRATIGSNI